MNTRNLTQNERLIHFRIKSGMNQSELAIASNLTPAAISKLESEPKRDPALYAAKNIAKALGISIDVFAGNSTESQQLTELAKENSRLKRKLEKISKALNER